MVLLTKCQGTALLRTVVKNRKFKNLINLLASLLSLQSRAIDAYEYKYLASGLHSSDYYKLNKLLQCRTNIILHSDWYFNPLKPELNPICYLLALFAHHFLHVSRIRVKSLNLRLLMSYIYIWSTYS